VKTKRVAILGSTGSIGRQALEVIDSQPQWKVCALAAGNNWRLLAEQARRYAASHVAVASPAAAGPLAKAVGDGPAVHAGPDAMTELVRTCEADVVLSGVVGTAGLVPTLAAIDCGATVALANKETLVLGGSIVMPAARAAGVDVLPVDSEHSAIFQCLAAGRREEVRRVVITASGGALRDWDEARVREATVADALRHPTWSMGPKITIDSATLINKALEVVEARWLFDLGPDQIAVVGHGESIVHSYVEFRDGSVIAQMGRPDMTTPIAYALSYPHRAPRDVPPLDLPACGPLTFWELTDRFDRAVALGFEALRRGPAAAAALNAANEAAVRAFLDGQIPFGEIVPLVETVVNLAASPTEVTLEALLGADAIARRQVEERISAGAKPRLAGQ